MDAQTQKIRTYKGPFRMAVSATVLAVMLGGCSAVPDAVNPVKWYEKTTDFFSGDQQASNPQAESASGQSVAQNGGLSADPNAPAPAPARQDVSQATGGLSGDVGLSNYASPPIARQNAATDILQPSETVALNTPPAPLAQPIAPVAPAPLAAPMPAPQVASLASKPVPAYGTTPSAPPKRLAFADAPPPPEFNIPNPSATAQFGGDRFETVVISGSGMEDTTVAAPARRLSAFTDAGASAAQKFPTPGHTAGPAQMITQAVNRDHMSRVATIHFANNSSNMDERDRSILSAVIQLQKERGGRVVVIGHASSRTKDMDYVRHKMVNFKISMKRAMTIGSALKAQGLRDQALEVQAVSDAEPQYLEVMPSGEVGNRRVEIYLAAL